MAQNYIVKASGKLTRLDHTAEMAKHEPTKYYILKNYFIDKSNIGIQTAFETSGKHNESLNMSIYIVMPICAKAEDTVQGNCYAWLGKEYAKTISNRLSAAEKEDQYNAFAKRSQEEFNQTDFSQFVYLDRMESSGELDEFKKAVTKSTRYRDITSPIFKAVNESFAARNKDNFSWICIAVGIGLFVWLIMILIPKFDANKLEQYDNGKPLNNNKDVKAFFGFFVPRGGTFMTTVILDINIVVFLLMMFAGLGFMTFKTADLIPWGANYGPLTKGGEWWRLLTNIFLHGGLMHIAGNMFGLVFAGLFLEPVLGRARFLLVYLLTGIIASIASLWWYDAVVSVGASGAIFGLYGIFIALLLTKVFHKSISKVFLVTTLIFVGYNLIMGLAGGIDNAAHIGGLLSGLIIGLLVRLTLKKEPVHPDDVISEEEQEEAV